MINKKILPLVYKISAVLIVLGINKTATAASFSPAPIFNDVSRYSTIISVSGNESDIYFPNPPNLKTGNYSLPVALLLQGGLVDKSNYSSFASTIARYGFIVIVPNSKRSIPQSRTVLAPQTSQINAVLTQIKQENSNPNSPIKGVINTQKLALLGHSLGGAVGLSAIGNLCVAPILCQGSFNRPKELVAGAFYGANLRDQNDVFTPINNAGIPIALLQGTLDSRALPFRAERTYDNIQTSPKTLVSILGANHFGITNTNNPTGAIPDPTKQTLEQNVAVETIARWSGLFLRASVLGDKNAIDYVYSTGDRLDPNVTVIKQAKQIPEAASVSALIAVSSISILWGSKKRY
ncbi:MAG: alpha/beta hydrolase [Scytonematopsis contorta HA4267-MV1]|jgi:dienelactone hydrolase|nr:alpha/beta hydrolase [Scytonematopsis contorta HA4267-MV1]